MPVGYSFEVFLPMYWAFFIEALHMCLPQQANRILTITQHSYTTSLDHLRSFCSHFSPQSISLSPKTIPQKLKRPESLTASLSLEDDINLNHVAYAHIFNIYYNLPFWCTYRRTNARNPEKDRETASENTLGNRQLMMITILIGGCSTEKAEAGANVWSNIFTAASQLHFIIIFDH